MIGRHSLWLISFGAISTVYLLQTATPLRLDDDTVDYLRMAAALTDGRSVPTLLPIGFPVILSMLDRAGLGSSFYFVLANCFFLGLGLFALWRLLANYPESVRWATLLFSLLAIPVIKSVPIALPEAAFFCVSLLALWAMTAAGDATLSKRRWLLAFAFVCVAAAVSLRTVGLALLPPLAWACAHVPSGRGSDTRRFRSRGWIVFAAVLSASLIVLVWRSEPFLAYEQWLRDYYWQGDAVRQIARRFSFVLSGLGEIVVNLPFSRFRDWRLGFAIAGAISFVAVAIGFRRARAPLNPTRLYLLTYGLVIAVWPNPSPRLWMPVIPLLVAEIGLLISRLPNMRWKTELVAAYAAWFAMTGIAALAYTSRISWSGANFQNVYGRNGGMPTTEVDASDPNWGHIQYYKAEATKMIERYDGHGAGRK